jgi:predicted metal-dependent TIM-barrel fold hydrolase
VGPTASIEEQKAMMRPGVYFEHCFFTCMPGSDRLDPMKIVEAVQALGPEHCILSTDFGQITSPPPVEGLRMYIELMRGFGITEDEIHTMVKENPARLLGLPAD